MIRIARFLLVLLFTFPVEMRVAAEPAGHSGVEIPIPQKRPGGPRIADSPKQQIEPAISDVEPEGYPASEKAVPPSPESPRQYAECLAALASMKVDFTEEKPIIGQQGCGIALPISISILPGNVAFSGDTRLRCETALALAKWVDGIVLRAAKTWKPEARLSEIRHASTYVCRSRNGVSGARVSEHGKGNAVDIASFVFSDGTTLSIEPRYREADMAEAFQRTVRFGACLHFTTVLGPFSDAFHNDHLHLDIAKRNRGYRLCRLPEAFQTEE